ncbi:hypothetical protein [Lignipirellula cremea]|uniref:Uncharacterized protein n=1 Tax=Lignipirellula cremea TaxID=2528010 RepID=A0A518DNN7_9BACT|nr:hypothetical protein [Lignipirellula cremea]QDU93458.1 hypothetical protein Pla8534_12380 [Lignipirellula cremea]
MLARCLGILLITLSGANIAQAVVRETFESADPVFRLAHADCQARVLSHLRVFGQAHSGQGAEWIRLQAGHGSYAYLAYEMEPARVISELNASLWVRSDRKGLQLMMRVVLPRTYDQATRAPIARLVRGQIYQQVGNWQRLEIGDPARLVELMAPALRSEFGAQVDVREAFVDMVVLNGYGGFGETQVWLDDLEVTGHVATTAAGLGDAARDLAGNQENAAGSNARRISFDDSPAGDASKIVQFQGSVLLVEGRPWFARAIEYNGEPFTTLKSLGFNTIRLRQPATTPQLEEAKRLDLKLLAPPPTAPQPGQMVTDNAAVRIGPIHDPIIAWDLGENLGPAELEPVRALADNVRRSDPLRRPVWLAPNSQLRQYSRIGEVVCFNRALLGGGFEMTDYGPWVLERTRLSRPGSPFWATIQTQLSPSAVDQNVALSETRDPRIHIEPDQIRLLALNAVASGARGLLFASRSRLDLPDTATQIRAASLRRINLELDLVEPWAAGGKYMGEIETNQPLTRAAVLETERSRLMIVLRQGTGQQFTLDAPDNTSLSLVDPGSPIDAAAFRVSLGGLSPLRSIRRSGGVRVSLDDVGVSTLVLFSQNPLTPSNLTRRIAEKQTETARLHFELATAELKSVEETDRRLNLLAHPLQPAASWLDDARANLRQCEQLIAGRDYRSAQMFAARAQNALARVRRGHWNTAAGSFSSPVASPLCTTFDTLPEHWRLAERMKTAHWSPNILAGGKLETLDHLLRSGWRHFRHADTPLQTSIEVSSELKKGGVAAVRMRVWADKPELAPAVVETPPIWISSAPTPLRGGQLVRIHGWVLLPQEIVASRDGFVVFDSLGGPDLGQRMRSTGQWTEFTFYRRAPRDTELVVTFALAGLGEAWLDEVTIEPIELPAMTPSPLPVENEPGEVTQGFFNSLFR